LKRKRDGDNAESCGAKEKGGIRKASRPKTMSIQFRCSPERPSKEAFYKLSKPYGVRKREGEVSDA